MRLGRRGGARRASYQRLWFLRGGAAAERAASRGARARGRRRRRRDAPRECSVLLDLAREEADDGDHEQLDDGAEDADEHAAPACGRARVKKWARRRGRASSIGAPRNAPTAQAVRFTSAGDGFVQLFARALPSFSSFLKRPSRSAMTVGFLFASMGARPAAATAVRAGGEALRRREAAARKQRSRPCDGALDC